MFYLGLTNVVYLTALLFLFGDVELALNRQLKEGTKVLTDKCFCLFIVGKIMTQIATSHVLIAQS